MSESENRWKKYLMGIVVSVLIVSIGLDLYDQLVIIPKIQAEGQANENNLRVQAFNVWLNKMETIKSLLGQVQTYLDLEEVDVHASWVLAFEHVIETGIDAYNYKENLYYWIGKATFYLSEAVHDSFLYRNLDRGMISNVTLNIGPPLTQLSVNGVELAQQMREAGILEEVLNHLEQIYQVTLNFIVTNHY